ncbi:hypothetical protein D3C81_1870990 [compost metagenome]
MTFYPIKEALEMGICLLMLTALPHRYSLPEQIVSGLIVVVTSRAQAGVPLHCTCQRLAREFAFAQFLMTISQ